MSNRIEIFKQLLESDPQNTMILFGLANEYIKVENHEAAIATLESYLSKADDEGAAYGMLARSYEKIGEHEKAKAALEAGIKAAQKYGHPSMAEDFQTLLDAE
jgi:E3 SUMO-protein ligase RanBP2